MFLLSLKASCGRSEATEAWLLALAERERWAVLAADWRGLAKADLPVPYTEPCLTLIDSPIVWCQRWLRGRCWLSRTSSAPQPTDSRR